MLEDWEAIYSADTFRDKNEYPSEEIVSFIMRNYGASDYKELIHVLDMGCGWGNNLKFLKDKGFFGVGIDISKTAIQHCKSSGYNASVCDFSKLTFSDNSFDIVIDRQAIQHNTTENIIKTLNEVRRVLKKGGVFFSIMVSKANYDVDTTYTTEKIAQKLLTGFKIISIDKQSKTFDNQKIINESLIIHAQKI
jgi:ubiquinone/menaquinone biosynthesis C-methylase UbiE